MLKVPFIWKFIGWSLAIFSVIGVILLIRLSSYLDFSLLDSFYAMIVVVGILSALVSFSAGVLLIRGNIWGYHLIKVLLVFTVIGVLFDIFGGNTNNLVTSAARIALFLGLINANQTKLYLSFIRNDLNKNE